MDVMYRRKCHVEALTPALTVLTSVTSRAADRVVVDAGFKTLSSGHQPPEVYWAEMICVCAACLLNTGPSTS